jgi:ubiquinone/menaquinone biosynthesis C-methylase UbiE
MKKILNVGCGNDTYGTHFVDIYPARKEVIRCDVDEEVLPFPDNSFDEVYAKFVLEHVKNINNFLKKTKKVLKKGGKIIIITDNAGCWAFHFPLKFDYSLQHYDNSIREKKGHLDRHYSILTPLHLKNHLSASGFSNIRIKYMWFENKTTTLKNHLFFITCDVVAKIIAIFLPDRNSYPHIVATAVK